MPFTSPTSLAHEIVIGPIEAPLLFGSLTDPDITPAFFNKGSFQCKSLEPGGTYMLVVGETVVAEGTIVEYAPPTLAITFQQRWNEAIKDPPGQVRMTVRDREPLCQLTIEHTGLTPGSDLNSDFEDGWLLMASGLKTLIECNRVMPLTDEELNALRADIAEREAEAAPQPAAAPVG